MTALVLRRFLTLIPTLLGLSFIVFMSVAMLPGDPARLMAGERATPEALAEIRRDLGLDKPLLVRYGLYLGSLLQGDLGRSITSNRPVLDEMLEHFPATVELTMCAMLFALIGGMTLGLYSAVNAGRGADFVAMGLAVCGVSMPIFLLGILLMLTFSLWLPELTDSLSWLPRLQLPSGSRLSPTATEAFATRFYLLESLVRLRFDLAWEAARHLLLPSIALGTIPLSIIARMTRGSVLEVLGNDYIRVARAKGLSGRAVLLRHALANALLPVITVTALQVGYLLGGAIITERVFSWPGVGTWLLNGVNARDFRVIQGGVLAVAICFVLVNLIADLLYVFANPRLRT